MDGTLVAGALLTRTAFGGLAAAANDHSGDWDAVAQNDDARRELWSHVADSSAAVVTLAHLREPSAAREALELAGRRVHETPGSASPHLVLPRSFDELLQAGSRNLRSQVGRRRRGLQRQGHLVLRTTTGGSALPRDLDAFLQVEASGWKGRAGTAILSEPRTELLYRDFANAAAERGWLRLHLLDLDGVVIAGSFDCAIGDRGFLIKTGFDETHASLSPGLVLRAEALRSNIEEGLSEFEFLGAADAYKLRWTTTVRPRVTVRGYRGAASLPHEAYRRGVRPVARRGVQLARRAHR